LGNDIEDLKNHSWKLVDERGLPKRIISHKTFISDEGFMLEKEKPVDDERRISGVFGALNQLFCDHLYTCKILIRPTVDQLIFKGVYQDRNLTLYQSLLSELPVEQENSWRTAKELIKAIDDLTTENNTNLLIVNIPVRELIYDPKGVLKHKTLDTKRLERFLSSERIPQCDLQKVFEENPKAVYYRFDAHLTSLGNLYAAEEIKRCLIRLEIL